MGLLSGNNNACRYCKGVLLLRYQTLGRAEGTHNGGSVLMLGINGVIEPANVGGGELASEIRQRGAELRELRECGLAHDGDGVVGREVVAVVLEGDEAESINEAISGVAGDDVHLMIQKRAIDEAEVHDFRRFGKVEMVAGAETGESVGALEKFVAHTGTPLRRDRSEIGNRAEVKILGIVAANDEYEGIFEAKRLGDFEMETLGVQLPHATINDLRIVVLFGSLAVKIRRFIEDGSQGRARVFDVEIELAGKQGFVDEKRAAEVRLADDGNACFRFNVLGKKLGEDDLLGEKFRANGNFGRSLRTATAQDD